MLATFLNLGRVVHIICHSITLKDPTVNKTLNLKLMLTLLITWSSLSAETSVLNQVKTPLHTLLCQIKEQSIKNANELSHMASQSLDLMQQITQELESKQSPHQRIHELFLEICNCINPEDGTVVDLANIQPHDVRLLRKKITACNNYISGNNTFATMHLFKKITDFNETVLLCIEDAVELQLGFLNRTIDYLVYRPMEWMAENKLLTACCATVIVTGVVYYFYRPNNNDNNTLAGKNIRGITLVRGDITQQIFNDPQHAAIVNAANPPMLGGGGIDGVIHLAAGPGLRAECQNVPVDANGERCPIGQARITGGHNLAPLRIIHTVGPDTRIPAQNAQRQALLGDAYESSLNLAEDNQIRHIALPSISTGIFRYPIQEAAQIAVDNAIQRIQQVNNPIEEIRFVTFDQNDFDVYRQVLAERCNLQEQIPLAGTANGLHCFNPK